MTSSAPIAAIERALEGVTPGHWYPGHLGTDNTCQCRSIVDDGCYMGGIATVHVANGLPIGEGGNDAPPADEAAANMRFIAACNPVAITSLLSLARKAAEKDAEIARLREIVSKSAEAIGNGAYIAPLCSIDFMAGLPKEIEIHIASLPNIRHFEILAEAMAEVKATSDGLSDQPIADIVSGCLDELAGLSASRRARSLTTEISDAE